MTGQAAGRVSGFAGEPGLPGSDLEFRLPRAYRQPALRRFAGLAVLTVLLALTPLPAAVHGAAWLTGVLAAVYGIAYVWRGRFATRTTSRGIEARGYVNHFVPWEDVAGLDTGGSAPADARLSDGYSGAQYVHATISGGVVLGAGDAAGRQGRLATVQVVRTSGRRLRLPAPLVTGWAADPDFDDKARQLQELCRRYGRPPAAGQP